MGTLAQICGKAEQAQVGVSNDTAFDTIRLISTFPILGGKEYNIEGYHF